MQVWSLSSGSSGNCYLVREGATLLLVEAGLGSRRVAREMAALGLSHPTASAVLVSHEHADHWLSAEALAARWRAPLLCTPGTLGAECVNPSVDHEPLIPGRSIRVGTLAVECFSVPHDARDPVGFFIRSDAASCWLATDMGFVGEEMIERARGADLVILEANHDVEMLRRGPYPQHLKERILSERGHLSNEEAASALIRMAVGRPRRFWLAHLSQTNNSPGLALASVREVLRREGLEKLKVSVALRDRRSLFWDSEAELEQLPLS